MHTYKHKDDEDLLENKSMLR